MKLKDLFKIPNKPKDLPLKLFSSNKEEFCWEDWEEQAKTKHPIRYFLSEDLPQFFSVKIERPVEDFVYWLKCNLLPSKKYHFLDLRQPKNVENSDKYQYGWIDADKQLLYACFNILVNFVEKEHKGAASYQEHIENQEKIIGNGEILKEEREILEIYHWWKTTRQEKLKSIAKDSNLCFSSSYEEKEQFLNLSKKICEAETDLYSKETEMLKKLIQLRMYLWT